MADGPLNEAFTGRLLGKRPTDPVGEMEVVGRERGRNPCKRPACQLLERHVGRFVFREDNICNLYFDAVLPARCSNSATTRSNSSISGLLPPSLKTSTTAR